MELACRDCCERRRPAVSPGNHQGARPRRAPLSDPGFATTLRSPGDDPAVHRLYLNGPGRPPISGFGFVSAALRCSSTHVRSLRLRRSLARGEGRKPPCTSSSVLDFVHSGSAPVLAKASPKPELDGRRPRLRYRGWEWWSWERSTSPAEVTNE